MLALPDGVALPRPTRVAIVGGTPLPGQLKALGGEIEILKGQEEGSSSNVLREHTGTAASVVRMALPNARLVFVPMISDNGGVGEFQIITASQQLIATKPDVLLIPLQFDSWDNPSEVMKLFLTDAAKSTVVVVPSGNNGPSRPPQFGQLAKAGQVLVVDSVDGAGKRSDFASNSTDVFWAPGERIHVTGVDSDGKAHDETRNGTTFSAALAAGLAAHIRAEKPDPTPAQVIDRLRKTSRALTPGGPPVLHLQAALNAK